VTPQVKSRRRLSEIDAAFLYLERREIPLNIGGVGIFEGEVPFEEFVAAIDSKLHLIPRYRQVVAPPPFNLGHPTWEDYPRFNIRDHIHHVTLAAPGTEAELEALAGNLFSQVMDRAKPLWHTYVVDGLEGGRGAVIVLVHHALADGIAGASILKIMFDSTPEGSHALPKQKKPRRRPQQPNHSLAAAVASAIHSSLKNMVAAEAALMDFASNLLTDRMQTGLEGMLGLLPEWAQPVERLPFNKPCGAERKFCWMEADFADLQAIREKLGGTINDVVLAIVTRAISRYTKFHGHPVERRFVRVVCPVSVRNDDPKGSLGNQITFLPVVLPMGVDDPSRLLHAVTKRMEIMKSVRAAELVAIMAAWIGATPPPMQAIFWEGLPLLPLPVPVFNLICTNVPGSPVPLYAVGRRMLSSYPQVPTGYELGFGIAVQSYAGKMCFGVTADAQAAPDFERLRSFLQDALRDFSRAAGVKKARKRTHKPTTVFAA
jgi:WS/DGAT/MGAT family acyltransferase